MTAQNEGNDGGPKVPSSYLAAAIIFGAVVFYFAIGTLTASDNSGETDLEAATRAPFKVLTAEITPSSHPLEVRLSGRTEAGRRVVVRAETPGQVDQLITKEGTQVKKGDELCRITPDSRTAIVAQAQAAVVKAQTDFEAADRLFKEGFTSDAGLKSARANRDAARAQLAQARQDLSNTRITAPFDGLVAETLVEPGDFLNAGAGCAVLVDLRQIVIAGGVPAHQAALLSVGDEAKAEIPGRPAYDAKVSFVSDVANDRTRAFRVELEADNELGLADGLDAEAMIVAGTASAVLIPRNALVFSDEGQLGVRTLKEQSGSNVGDVSFVPVTIVSETNDGVFITGISERTNLIIRGQDYVSAGTSVGFERSNSAQGG